MAEPLVVKPLPAARGRDWDSLRRRFRGRPRLTLRQAWRAEPSPLFSGGEVRLGLSGMSLAVFAALRDRDVFNPVKTFNVAPYPHGDTFEIFLQPEGQAAYFEFHITPHGSVNQLRWPRPIGELQVDWTTAADPFLPYRVSRWRVRSQARLVAGGWEVHAEVPLRRVFEGGVPWDGSHLRVNFSRYDWTLGRPRPVISATAPLTEANFHCAAEWDRVELRFR